MHPRPQEETQRGVPAQSGHAPVPTEAIAEPAWWLRLLEVPARIVVLAMRATVVYCGGRGEWGSHGGRVVVLAMHAMVVYWGGRGDRVVILAMQALIVVLAMQAPVVVLAMPAEDAHAARAQGSARAVIQAQDQDAHARLHRIHPHGDGARRDNRG